MQAQLDERQAMLMAERAARAAAEARASEIGWDQRSWTHVLSFGLGGAIAAALALTFPQHLAAA